MANQMSVDSFTAELYDLLCETFERTQGIFLDRGTSLLETLDAISADQASRSVSPAGASIASHVEHIRFYLDVLEGCIRLLPLPSCPRTRNHRCLDRSNGR